MEQLMDCEEHKLGMVSCTLEAIDDMDQAIDDMDQCKRIKILQLHISTFECLMFEFITLITINILGVWYNQKISE